MTNEEFIKSISLEGEAWKDVIGYEGLYLISSLGRVVSLGKGVYNGRKDVYKEPRLLTPKMDNTLKVGISKDTKNTTLRIAKAVLEAFVPAPKEYTVIEYKDGNKYNCAISNICYRKPIDRHKRFDTATISNEIWKPIRGYEDLYEISSLGRIKSKERIVHATNRTMIYQEKILKPFKVGKGYLSICLVRDNKKKFFIHRLVAESFIDNPNNYTDIDHINTIKTDNRVNNLRWVSKSMNMKNPITVKRLSIATTNNPSYNNCSPVVCLLDGEVIKEYKSIASAKRDGFSYSSIQRCLYGIYKQHNGFQWMYLSDYENLANKSKNIESTNEKD